MSFGDPGITFSDFLKVLEIGLEFYDFSEVPWGSQAGSHTPGEGNTPVRGSTKQLIS